MINISQFKDPPVVFGSTIAKRLDSETYQSWNMTSGILIWSTWATIFEKSPATSKASNDPRCFLPFFILGSPPSRPDILCRYNPMRGIIFPSASRLLVTHFGCLLISGRCDALRTTDNNDRRCNMRRTVLRVAWQLL